MKKFIARYALWLLLGLFFILYSITGSLVLDPDFGWEIPLGSYILNHGIPSHDIFTYSMPSYQFVDHEWATHAAMAWLLPRIGMIGLAIIFAGFAVSAVFVATRNAPRAWRHIMVVLLGMLILNLVSVRPQVISFLFFALTSQLILSPRLWLKYRWYVPLMFLIWTNLHGGFVIGLGAMGLMILLKIFEEKHIRWSDCAVVAASAAATLINPYGFRLWHEVLLSVFDTRLRYTVNEWMPTIVTLEPTIWFFIAVSITYMVAKHEAIQNNVKILFAVFLFLGLTSYRNVALFAIFAAGASTFGYEALRQTTLKRAAYRQRFSTFHSTFFKLLLIGAVVHICTLHVINIKRNTETENYPKLAVEYLRSHPQKGEMLSLYEWGGYLLWKYPEKRVYVDGRMPSWRQDVKNKPYESADASWEYLEMFRFTKPFKPVLERHKVQSILIKTDMITVDKNANENKKKEVELLLEQMKINNMKIVYQDRVATLFARR